MEKYIDLLRVIIKNFNIDNNSEFDEYYHNQNKISYCIDNLYKKYNI